MQIGGTAPDQFDRITSSRPVQIDGLLDVSLINGFVPVLGDSFSVLSATNSISGTFLTQAFELPRIGVGFGWHINYNPSQVLLSVVEVAGLPGDYNEDQVVNAADYTVWRNLFGTPAGSLPNDIASGTIGFDQFNLWRTNYGLTLGATSAEPLSIPEPASWTLLMLVCVACYIRFSKRPVNDFCSQWTRGFALIKRD